MEEDEAEKAQRLFQLLHKMIDERKVLFEESNVGNYYEYTRKHSLPVIIVVIDNYIRFMEAYNDRNDNFLNDFTLLTREGTKCGIQFVVTITKITEMKLKQRTNFLNAIGLYTPEKGDYRDLYSVAATFIPPSYRGRGLYLVGKKLLEYHTALPVEGASEAERNEVLLQKLAEIGKRNEGFERATPIPLIPKDETYAQFVEDAYISKSKFPVGYDTTDISKVYVDFQTIYCYGYGDNMPDNSGISLGLRNILYFFTKTGTPVDVIKLNKRISLNTFAAQKVYTAVKDVYAFLREIENEMFSRILEKNEFRTVDKTSDFAPIIWGSNRQRVIIIDSLPALAEMLESNQCRAMDEEPVNKELGAMIKDMELIFKQGQDYGIYFVAGFPTSDTTPEMLRKGMVKEFLDQNNVQHLGGNIYNAKVFKCPSGLGNAATQALPVNISNVVTVKGRQVVHIPEYLD